MSDSPFQVFHNWLFDGSRNSPLPKATDKVDILKYNSPITHTYVLSMFPKNGPLNFYLNTYLNNMNLRYLDKTELFMFIKKCVLDFRVKRRDVTYFPYKRHSKLFTALREKLPDFKNYEIKMICERVEHAENRDEIYETLGIDKPKRKKFKKKKRETGKISLRKYLIMNFSAIDV